MLPLVSLFKTCSASSMKRRDRPWRTRSPGFLATGRSQVGLANHTVLLARDGTERPIDDTSRPDSGQLHGIIGGACAGVSRRDGAARQVEQTDHKT